MNKTKLLFSDVITKYPSLSDKMKRVIDLTLLEAISQNNRKIIVLDDDPTGVQTVHDVFVYTDWSFESILNGFKDEHPVFYVLTNSRAFTKDETMEIHKVIAKNIVLASKAAGRDYIVVSRSDSTMRGHYPAEPLMLRNTIEKLTNRTYDGEIICPFFKEGGRYTIYDSHYVHDKQVLIPISETEFAQDRTFGYKNSNLRLWIKEKINQDSLKIQIASISLEDIREQNTDRIYQQLMQTTDFSKVIVNALDDYDIKVFAIAFFKALNAGKNYIFRSAATIPKIIGGISDFPLLKKEQLCDRKNSNGGLIVIGSYVKKTTIQMEGLKKLENVEFVPFNSDLVLQPLELMAEIERISKLCNEILPKGRTVVLYTCRDLLSAGENAGEKNLKISTSISAALADIISYLDVKPAFIIGKGGITSSDIGTKSLRVRKALVMGQVMPGIPVWKTGNESKFPDMPYIIFPGNVGDESTLFDLVKMLTEDKSCRIKGGV